MRCLQYKQCAGLQKQEVINERAAWTVNDVFVNPHPFLFWSIHTILISKKGVDRPKQERCGSTKTSLTVHTVGT